MYLFIVRHGQSTNNAISVAEPGDEPTGGWIATSDPELTPVGHRQAALVGRFIAQDDSQPGSNGFDLTHLYTSLMARAVATAEAISAAVDLAPVAWPEVHEWGGLYRRDGSREGLPGPGRAFFTKHFPRLVLPDTLGDEGWWNRPREEAPMVVSRARKFLREFGERHGGSDDRVAVVSHGGFFRALRRFLLGVPPGTPPFGHPDEPRPPIHNTSISCFDFGSDGGQERPHAVYLNRIDHLPADLVT